jgi:hypothetical protein
MVLRDLEKVKAVFEDSVAVETDQLAEQTEESEEIDARGVDLITEDSRTEKADEKENQGDGEGGGDIDGDAGGEIQAQKTCMLHYRTANLEKFQKMVVPLTLPLAELKRRIATACSVSFSVDIDQNSPSDRVGAHSTQGDDHSDPAPPAPAGLPMQIFCKTLTGKTIVVDCGAQDHVAVVKQRIALKTPCPVAHQRLIFASKSLEDDKTLEEYNIQKDCTLHLIVNMCTRHLRDASPAGADRTSVELFFRGSAIATTSETDAKTLHGLGFGSTEHLYVVFRCASTTSPASETYRDSRGGGGQMAQFAIAAEWQPHLFHQDAEGMMIFLSCMYVVTDYLAKHVEEGDLRDRLLACFRHLTAFPPAVQAWYQLTEGKGLSPSYKAALCSALIPIFRAACPPEVADSALFQQSRGVFHFLLSVAADIDVKLCSREQYATISLLCSSNSGDKVSI